MEASDGQYCAVRKKLSIPSHSSGWSESLGWVSLEEAKKSKKPALVFIHNPKCPRCRKLKARLVSHPGVRKLSANFAMVHLTPEEIPAEERDVFTPDGKYIPRILFFDANFNFLPEVKGSEPTYQYFYSEPNNIEINMRRVLYMVKD
ncbi:thioredoxin domain-containing protein 12 [Plakobranchus ocellatus]|uniref:Thioredoxin domain-containing protein 12 n=1 Tax=Plakobranchus ocellatus TaxID=259542 RepID=A0AAV3YWB2_9GAST|nr:thioredoxin domain-containing protein 12 [Plakobranchus ocellatus]